MSQMKIGLPIFFFALLMLACDLPFIAREKTATYVEATSTDVAALSTPAPSATEDATQEANATLDANATPGTPGTAATRRPAATRGPAAVFVVSLRTDPVQPRSGPAPVTFYVRFQSTFTTNQPYRWLVKIYRAGETKSFGETAAITTDIPPGISEIPSANNWHTNPFQCETYTARVYWVEAGLYADPIEFKKPDNVNTSFVDFKVCP